MLAGFLANLKWALVIAIVAGSAIAYANYSDGQTLKRVLADGIETTAAVDGGDSKARRGAATGARIHAIWTDANGDERAESIEVSSEYARKIIDGGLLVIEDARVKYLPGEPDVAALVTEDGPQRIADKELSMYLGAGAGVLGLIGSAILMLTGRRRSADAAKG